ncbi:MAG: hypothetical protein KGL44_12150 [Sphingomonadales bacterium]|nr:hypothetical protein [Sphingomonadales bacterium]
MRGETMRQTAYNLFAAMSALALSIPAPVQAQSIDFGDDSSQFAKDGECDDMRFSGAGMTDTLLIDSDIKHDATDCRSAYNAGRLTYGGGHRNGNANTNSSNNSGYAASGTNHIMWGDDSSRYSKDGECDDKRFAGPGMTDTPLLDSDVKHDATDCRAAYNAGRLWLRN